MVEVTVNVKLISILATFLANFIWQFFKETPNWNESLKLCYSQAIFLFVLWLG